MARLTPHKSPVCDLSFSYPLSQYKYYGVVVLGQNSPLSLSHMSTANPPDPGSSCVDLYYLSIQCRHPCVIEELQTREVSVNVPESLLKDMVCGH